MPAYRLVGATSSPAPQSPCTRLEQCLSKVRKSILGGPRDTGMSADEGLALFTQADLQNRKYSYSFLPTPPPGATGLWRRLNPDKSILPAVGITTTRQGSS